jgi:hypothetical protein
MGGEMMGSEKMNRIEYYPKTELFNVVINQHHFTYKELRDLRDTISVSLKRSREADL